MGIVCGKQLPKVSATRKSSFPPHPSTTTTLLVVANNNSSSSNPKVLLLAASSPAAVCDNGQRRRRRLLLVPREVLLDTLDFLGVLSLLRLASSGWTFYRAFLGHRGRFVVCDNVYSISARNDGIFVPVRRRPKTYNPLTYDPLNVDPTEKAVDDDRERHYQQLVMGQLQSIALFFYSGEHEQEPIPPEEHLCLPPEEIQTIGEICFSLKKGTQFPKCASVFVDGWFRGRALEEARLEFALRSYIKPFTEDYLRLFKLVPPMRSVKVVCESCWKWDRPAHAFFRKFCATPFVRNSRGFIFKVDSFGKWPNYGFLSEQLIRWLETDGNEENIKNDHSKPAAESSNGCFEHGKKTTQKRRRKVLNFDDSLPRELAGIFMKKLEKGFMRGKGGGHRSSFLVSLGAVDSSFTEAHLPGGALHRRRRQRSAADHDDDTLVLTTGVFWLDTEAFVERCCPATDTLNNTPSSSSATTEGYDRWKMLRNELRTSEFGARYHTVEDLSAVYDYDRFVVRVHVSD